MTILTLSGGKKIEVPFDAFVVFATNLDPADLADELLRRIPNKQLMWTMRRRNSYGDFSDGSAALIFALSDRSMAPNLALLSAARSERSLSPHCYVRDISFQILWKTPPFLGGEVQISQSKLEPPQSYFLDMQSYYCASRGIPNNSN